MSVEAALGKPDMSGEMWRITAIAPEPLVCRPDDWFSPDDYVVCRIRKIWTAARIIELGGGSPRTFMLCVNPGRHVCRPRDGCMPECGDRFWGNVSQGDILGERDLLQILYEGNLRYSRDITYQNAIELFDMIWKIKERQRG
jgi:hypothetical protein